MGNTVVKREGNNWYSRDKTNHIWKLDFEWERRFYDAQYDVIEITYDEENEIIKERKRIDGFFSTTDEELLNP